MRVEIVDDTEGRGGAAVFPPGQDYIDLREAPNRVEDIVPAREHPPLRGFLAAVNGSESDFVSIGASTRSDAPAAMVAGAAYEFASQTRLIFAEPSRNFERERYLDLAARMKQLLEHDQWDKLRVVLRLSPCDFLDPRRRGFCLGIRLVAQAASAEQAEMRWGLGLARVQQALLFSGREMGEKSDA
jgi:hypothetical protein